MFLKVIISCRKGKTWGNSLQIPCLGKFWSLRYKKNLLNHSQRINKLTYEKVARRYNDFLFLWSALPSWKGSFGRNNVHVETVPSIMTQSWLRGSQIAVKIFFLIVCTKLDIWGSSKKIYVFFFILIGPILTVNQITWFFERQKCIMKLLNLACKNCKFFRVLFYFILNDWLSVWALMFACYVNSYHMFIFWAHFSVCVFVWRAGRFQTMVDAE